MKISRYIDSTLLKPETTESQLVALCKEAKAYGFAAVCINSYWVKLCKRELKDSAVKVCTVVGFPLGAMSTKAKVFEARNAIDDGADEIDMVINIGELKAGNEEAVFKDIAAVVQAVNGHCVKVILETCLLTDEEIVRACKLCIKANAAFVKTSTGFSIEGATVEHVRLIKREVDGKCEVKAAGGIRSYHDMVAMIAAGANRIGTSKGAALLQECIIADIHDKKSRMQ